jgi:hypothetical protein
MPIDNLPTISRVCPSQSSGSDAAHAEDGRIEPACSFDWDGIHEREERALAGQNGLPGDMFHVAPQPSDGDLSPEAIAGACKVIQRVVEWIWADGTKNTDGLQNRAAVVCWVFLPLLRPFTMADLAAGFGKHKQSLGRAVDSFKVALPEIRTCHMKV